MTEITKAYEFVIFATDESTPDLTFTDPDFHKDSSPPTYGGARIDPLKGTSESEPFTISILDTSEQITGDLSNADGRADLISRLWRLRINEDGGGLATVAQGRIVGINMNKRVGAYDFQCGDERFLTRGADIYRTVTTPTTQLIPAGLVGTFLTTPGQGTMQLIPEVVNSNEVLFLMVDGGPISDGIVEYIRNDLKADSVPGSSGGNTGNFNTLRIKIDGTDYEILSFNATLDSPELLGEIQNEGNENPVVLSYIWVAWFSTPVVEDVDEDGFVHAPNHVPSETVPFHIGGQLGTDLMVELTDRYTAEGVRFDTADIFKTWNASTAPNGLYGNPLIPDGNLRITSPMTLGELEDGLYKTFGLAPFLNGSGEVAPRFVTMPQDIAPGSLTNVTSAKLRGRTHPTWSQVGQAAKTVYRASYDSIRRIVQHEIDGERKWPADKLEATKFQLDDIEHDRVSDLGRHIHKVHLFGVLQRSPADRLAQQQATEIFDLYGDGPIRGQYAGLSSLDGITPGAFVTFDLSSYPDIETQTRGGSRMFLILERRMTPLGGEFEYIDAGPGDVALTAPSVAIIVNASRPKNDVDITISSLPAGAAGYTLQIKVGSENYKTVGQGTANETVTITNLPANTLITTRVRAFQVATIRSAWSATANVTTTALAAPSGVSVAITNRAATLTWTNGETVYDIMPTLDGADFLPDPLLAGSDTFIFTGLAASTSFVFGVKHVDPYGGASAIVTDTDTTGTAATLSAPKALAVIQGAPVDGSVVVPETLPYGAGLELSITRTEPHAAVEFQVSTDSFSTIEQSIAIEGVNTVRIQLPLDDVSRDVRARHRKDSLTSSAFTSTVSAKPTPFAQDASVADGFAGGYATISNDINQQSVVLSVGTADPDTDSAFYVLNKTGFVEPTTASTEILRSAMPFDAVVGTALENQDYAYLWLKFHNAIKGFGQSVKQRLGRTYEDPILKVVATRSGNTITITINGVDIAETLTAWDFSYSYPDGAGGTNSATNSTSWTTNSWSLGTRIWTSTLQLTVLEGVTGQVSVRATYNDSGGVSRTKGITVALENIDQVSKTIRMAPSDWTPSDDTIQFTNAGGTLRPRTASTAIVMYARYQVPIGAVITEVRARGKRVNAGDTNNIDFFDETNSLFAIPYAALTVATGAADNEVNSVVSKTVVSTTHHFQKVTMNGVANATDARLVWTEVDYDAPTYSNTL